MSITRLIEKSGIKRFLPDKMYLAIKFRKHFGYWMSFSNPRTFTEKMQWLKLYDRRPEYTKMVDKYAVKKYVADLIGEEHIIPTLGVWDKGEDIEWDKLPEKFVLKCTHNSGGLVICKDKSQLNKIEAVENLNRSLQHDYYLGGREWPYKNVSRRIIAEQYIAPAMGANDLVDYKWYCFNGEPKYCQVIQDRSTKETIDFFDVKWRHQEFVGLISGGNIGNAAIEPSRPQNLSLQVEIVRKLSQNIPFSRIDLYDIGTNVFFGEITFFPASGIGYFVPREYDEYLGEMINITM